jgi:hypothetical protein
MAWENELSHVMLYYRHDGKQEGGDADKDSKTTRFIFDLRLDRMGDVQLDGFHRGKRLDLIVRTKAPVSPRMQQEMRRAYTNAVELAGASGELLFQNRAEQFVSIKIEEDARKISV